MLRSKVFERSFKEREEMLRSVQKMIHFLTNKWVWAHGYAEYREDVAQHLQVATWEATLRWDEGRGVKWSVFAFTNMKQILFRTHFLVDLIRTPAPNGRRSARVMKREEGLDWERHLIANEDQDATTDLQLKEVAWFILLNTKKPVSMSLKTWGKALEAWKGRQEGELLQTIGDRLGLSKERVRQLEMRANEILERETRDFRGEPEREGGKGRLGATRGPSRPVSRGATTARLFARAEQTLSSRAEEEGLPSSRREEVCALRLEGEARD